MVHLLCGKTPTPRDTRGNLYIASELKAPPSCNTSAKNFNVAPYAICCYLYIDVDQSVSIQSVSCASAHFYDLRLTLILCGFEPLHDRGNSSN